MMVGGKESGFFWQGKTILFLTVIMFDVSTELVMEKVNGRAKFYEIGALYRRIESISCRTRLRCFVDNKMTQLY